MQVLTRVRRAVVACVAAVALCCALQPVTLLASEAASNGDAKAGDAHHGEHDTGVPLKWDRDLVLWSMVTFVVFLFVLKKAAWGPLVDGLNKREAKYEKLLVDAEHGRDQAMKMLAEYETKLKSAQARVDEIIAEARRDAEQTKHDIVAAAQAEADATRKRVTEELNRAKDQAINELFAHMRGNVLAATERVLARSLTDADHQRLIDEALAEVRRN